MFKQIQKIITFAAFSLFSMTAFAEWTTNGNGNIDLQIANTKHNDLKGKTSAGFNSKVSSKASKERGLTIDIPMKLQMGKNNYQQGGVNAGYRIGERFNIMPYVGLGMKSGKHKVEGGTFKQRRGYAEIGATSELHFVEDKFFIQPSIAYQHDFYNKYKADGLKDKTKGRAINTELAFNFKVGENQKGDSIYLRVAPYHEHYTNKADFMNGEKHKYRESGVRVGLKF